MAAAVTGPSVPGVLVAVIADFQSYSNFRIDQFNSSRFSVLIQASPYVLFNIDRTE